MSLEKGFRIGKYEIQKLLGTGGMGEVYLAEDAELGRPVAIKFLSSEFERDPKLLNRFRQEVRSVSALNHPHILTVHEFGHLDVEGERPLHYFVSEFVDGQTLRTFLEEEKVTLDRVLEIATQIASALVAAHEAGIIHRDIKPENIMIRRDGYVKILDFGLAKSIESDRNGVDLEAKTLVNTNPGTVMGTVNYMSPEQARGERVDARTDIWSLGVLLFEMITGEVPFGGETTSHRIVSILEKEPPPLSAFVGDVPELLQIIIDETLIKDREERCQTARELLGKLKRLRQKIDTQTELERSIEPGIRRSTDGRGGGSTPKRPQMTVADAHRTAATGEFENTTGNISSAEYIVNQIRQNKRGTLIAAIVGVLILSGLAFAAYRFFYSTRSRSEENRDPLKLTKLTNNGRSLSPVISPDGKTVVFLQEDSDGLSLRLRQVATGSFIELIPDFKGYFLGATFSPDGNDLYYVAGDEGKIVKSLYKISTLGGDTQKILDDVDSSVSFSPDGKKIVFLRIYPKEEQRVLITAGADGTNEERVLSRDFNTAIRSAVWSPDGKTIAYALYGQDEKGYYVHIEALDLETKAESRVTADRWRNIPSICWLPDSRGLLIAARDFASVPGSPNQIWKIPFPKGETVKITNDLNDYNDISIDQNGRNLVTQVVNIAASLWAAPVNKTGEAKEITPKSLSNNMLSWTPGGKILYTSREGGNNDLWEIKPDGSEKKQLTFDDAFESRTAPTADGKYIIYETNKSVGWSIWRMNSDGSDQVELQRNIGNSSPEVTPDSRLVIFSKNDMSLWKMPVGGGEPEKILEDRVFAHEISPDGRYLAYLTRADDLDAPLRIKIVSFGDDADVSQNVKVIDVPTGSEIFKWSPDGKGIDFIRTKDEVSNIWRIPLTGGEPKQITVWDLKRITGFAWSPDGRQIALSRGESTSDLVLLENF
ncbi:MAG: protein kinase [Pyrinomonadaceae bacterium]